MPEGEPLRIVQVCSSTTTSGAERHVLSLSQTLKARGHHIHAVVPDDGWLPNALCGAGISTHVTAMKGSGWSRTMGHLIRQVRSNQADVIHTHLTRAAYIGFAAGLLTRVPVVTSVHIANNDNIYKRLARGRNRLVAVSNFVAGMLYGKGVPKKFVDTIYNGTDFYELAANDPGVVRDELGIPRDRHVIGLVGKVCLEKGQLEMIAALKMLDRSDTHLVLVGRSEDSFQPEIDSAIDRAGLKDRVTFTGVRHDVARLLDSFTVSTLPSHKETFGVAAIEAMARSKPVVASRIGGIPEVVKHRHTGLLVDLRPEEIADALSYLISNAAEREQMGRNGRSLVEEKFSLEEMSSRFERLYRSVLT